jgi:hypothetical protein
MQRSLEIPLPPARRASGSESGIPKAEPWEQWEALEHKNERAYFCASRVPIFSSDPSKPVSLISACPAIALATAGEICVFCGAEPVSKKC